MISTPKPSLDRCERCGVPGGKGCGNGLEKVYPTMAVRYGYMKHIGEFTFRPGLKFSCGAQVVIKTSRGIELGEQVSLTCGGCSRSVTREQIQTYIRSSGPQYYQLESGRVLREATEDDLRESTHLLAGTKEKEAFCQAVSDRLKLPLKVVACEHLFGGERVIFYFLSEGRVDFRSLVKELAGEFQTRIEMRQIGVRDEARLLADFETCGRECCCRVFLKSLRQVSMKMAKLQKATLDPSKVSGRCKRLKCCLRYEHVAYEELDRRLPRVGTRVVTPHGDGVVLNRQILTQLVHVQPDQGSAFTVALEDVLERLGRDRKPAQDRAVEPAQPAGRPGRRQEGTRSGTSPQAPAGTGDRPPAKPDAGSDTGAVGPAKDQRDREACPPPEADTPPEKTGEAPTAKSDRRRRKRRRKRPPGPGRSAGENGPAGNSTG